MANKITKQTIIIGVLLFVSVLVVLMLVVGDSDRAEPDDLISASDSSVQALKLCGVYGDNAAYNPAVPYFIQQGADVSYNLAVSQQENDFVSTPELPDGLLLDPSTGLISGAPSQASTLDLYEIGSVAGTGSEACRNVRKLYFGVYKNGDASPLENERFRLSRVWGRSRNDALGFEIPYGTEFYLDQGQRRWAVTDCSRNRVIIFDDAGRETLVYGHLGSEVGELDTPADIKRTPEGGFAIAEEMTDRIQIFDSEFRPVLELRGPLDSKEYAFNHPLSLSYTAKGRLLVSDYGNHRVIGLDEDMNIDFISGAEVDGKPETGTAGGEFNGPYYTAFNHKNNTAVVVDRGNNRAQILAEDGTALHSFDASEQGGVALDFPHEVDVDPAGNIYIADTGNHRIVIFNQDGGYDYSFGTDVLFGSVKTIGIDNQGRLLTTSINNTIVFQLWEPIGSEPLHFDETSIETQFINTTAQSVADKTDADLTPGQINFRYCRACHQYPYTGAPKIGDTDEWQQRLNKKGLDMLYSHAISGYRLMPAKGGCMQCTDKQIKNTVDYFLALSSVRH